MVLVSLFSSFLSNPPNVASNIVEDLFRKGWKHLQKPKPPVQAVFRVNHTRESLGPYEMFLYVGGSGNEFVSFF
jgi:hypothetical protein